MECEACGKKTTLNYGDEQRRLCENCREGKTVLEGLDKEVLSGGLLEALGLISCIVAMVAFMLGLSENSLLSVGSGIFFVMLGAIMYTFGKLVPYIVSIEKSMRIMKDKSVNTEPRK